MIRLIAAIIIPPAIKSLFNFNEIVKISKSRIALSVINLHKDHGFHNLNSIIKS
jgi:hypothetical protein